MDDFKFINEVEGSSGRINSSSARTTIRAHATRHRWQTQTQLTPNQYLVKAKKPRKRKTSNDGSSSRDSRSSSGEKVPSPLEAMTLTMVLPDLSVSSILSRLDPDSNSMACRFFDHYAAEFNVVLCKDVQPAVSLKGSVCCDLVIQQESKALLHAICLTIAGHSAMVEAEVMDPRLLLQPDKTAGPLQRSALRHKVAAIHLLNKELAPSDGTPVITGAAILCVALLLAAETAVGDDIVALGAHMEGLATMVLSIGGLSCLSSAVALQVHLVDLKASLVLDSQPHFDHKFDRSLAKMDKSLLTSPDCQLLTPRYSAIISPRLVKLVQFTLSLANPTAQSPESGERDTNSSLEPFMILEHSLLSISPSLTLEECIRLALLLYINTTIWTVPPSFNWIVALRSRLQATLLVLDWESLAPRYSELLFWLFCLGRFTATPYCGAITWWSQGLRVTAGWADVTSWSGARSVLERFLYTDHVCAQTWPAMWKSVMSEEDTPLTFVLPSHPCSDTVKRSTLMAQ